MRTLRPISAAGWLVLVLGAGAQSAEFIRGDANGDGRVTLSDVAYIVDQLLPGALPGACASAAPPRDPDPAYGVTWSHPAAVRRGQRGVELFIQARSAAAIDGFSISYLVDDASLEITAVDFEGTIVPPVLVAHPEASSFFQWDLAPTLVPEVRLLAAGVVFVNEVPLERISFAATEGPLDGEPLLRVVANVRPEAPAGPGPRKVLWPAPDSFPGANEFAVGGKARVAGVVGELGIVIVDPGEFLRADANQDGRLDVSDPVSIFAYLFLGDPEPDCLSACDMNDDSTVDLSDGVFGLNYLVLGGPSIPEPTSCGLDPTVDGLLCVRSRCKA